MRAMPLDCVLELSSRNVLMALDPMKHALEAIIPDRKEFRFLEIVPVIVEMPLVGETAPSIS